MFKLSSGNYLSVCIISDVICLDSFVVQSTSSPLLEGLDSSTLCLRKPHEKYSSRFRSCDLAGHSTVWYPCNQCIGWEKLCYLENPTNKS